MAKEDERWKRRREREDEEEEQENQEKSERMNNAISKPRSTLNPSEEKIYDLMARAEPMIDQLNNLYQMYITGVDKIPPLERRKQLDQLILTLQSMNKPTVSVQFKFNAIQARYVTHCEKWERMMKALETGSKKPYGR